MPSASNPLPPDATWTVDAESSSAFSHTPALQAGLMGMVLLALATLWLMLQIPLLEIRLAVSVLPATLLAYLVYRLYLTLSSVEFFADHIDIRVASQSNPIPYDKIRQVCFDSFSHDLLVNDGTRNYRIPRTIQGHRAILHQLHKRIEVQRDHSLEMQIEVRWLPKAACAVSIAAMVSLAMVAAAQIGQFAIALAIISLPTAAILLDQCILRRYRLTPDELHVTGLRGTKVYRRQDLTDTWISKSGLSSRFQMTFKTGTVQFDEYLLSKALIQVTGYIERRWQHRVAPLSARR
jgi:hypothetical protein